MSLLPRSDDGSSNVSNGCCHIVYIIHRCGYGRNDGKRIVVFAQFSFAHQRSQRWFVQHQPNLTLRWLHSTHHHHQFSPLAYRAVLTHYTGGWLWECARASFLSVALIAHVVARRRSRVAGPGNDYPVVARQPCTRSAFAAGSFLKHLSRLCFGIKNACITVQRRGYCDSREHLNFLYHVSRLSRSRCVQNTIFYFFF